MVEVTGIKGISKDAGDDYTIIDDRNGLFDLSFPAKRGNSSVANKAKFGMNDTEHNPYNGEVIQRFFR